MDLDLMKPLYIFILDLTAPEDVTPLPKSLLRQCSQESVPPLGDHKQLVPAIRGSAPPFGSWSRDGKQAVELRKGQYAILVNDYLPADTQYKWLTLTGDEGPPGDIDPATGYSYEPFAFVDRKLPAEQPNPAEEIVIIVEKWGEYKSDVTKYSLEEWICNTDESDPIEDVHACKSTTKSVKLPKLNQGIDPNAETDNKNQQNNEISEVVITSETIKEVSSSSKTRSNQNDLSKSMDPGNKNGLDLNLKADENCNIKEMTSTSLTGSGDQVNEEISERTAKRMLRISESDAPEVDQVLKVMVCQKVSTVTIKTSPTSPKSPQFSN